MVNKETLADFIQKLLDYFNKFPELLSYKSHIEFLRHYFYHYINCDPL